MKVVTSSWLDDVKLSLITPTSHSNKLAYTYLATESFTTWACVGLRFVTIFSERVTICFLTIHFLNSVGSMPNSRVAIARASSDSDSMASPRPVISILPTCNSAANSRKIFHCSCNDNPTVDSALCVTSNSSASLTPGIVPVPLWLR